MVDNSKQLEVAENAIETYLVGRMSTAKLEEILSKSFSACTFGSSQREFRFVMCEPDSGSAPFGMRVFPEMAVLQSIAESAVVRFAPFRTIREMWAGCKSWVVEMDARLFDSRGFGMNHKELVACILHEMGHTVFSDTVPERFTRIFAGTRLKMKLADKAAVKMGYALFMVPLAAACAGPCLFRTVSLKFRSEENIADNMAVKNGYGEHLLSAIDKMVANVGATDPKMNVMTMEKETQATCEWSARMVTNMTDRRNKLANDLFHNGIRTNSEYMKETNAKVMTEVGIGLRENYTGDAAESILDVFHMGEAALEHYSPDYDIMKWGQWETAIECQLHSDSFTPGTPAFESIFRRKIKEGLPSWRDIDEISLNIDRMRTTTDKQIVLDKIHSFTEEIQEFMERVQPKRYEHARYKPEADRMLATLDQYRDLCLERGVHIPLTNKITDGSAYGELPPKAKGGLFHAPMGYEG